eukprot:67667-Rhodomonas_salina.6
MVVFALTPSMRHGGNRSNQIDYLEFQKAFASVDPKLQVSGDRFELSESDTCPGGSCKCLSDAHAITHCPCTVKPHPELETTGGKGSDSELTRDDVWLADGGREDGEEGCGGAEVEGHGCWSGSTSSPRSSDADPRQEHDAAMMSRAWRVWLGGSCACGGRGGEREGLREGRGEHDDKTMTTTMTALKQRRKR